MAHYYDAAYEMSITAKRDDAYYSLANRLAAEIVLAWPFTARRPLSKVAQKRLDAIESGLEKIRSIAEQTKPGTDFWTDTLTGNVLLGKCMARQEISETDLEHMRIVYSNAVLRGGSVRSLRSVTDHLRFFQAMAHAGGNKSRKDALVKSLTALRENVTAAVTAPNL
jgi:hypothetical protein